MLKAQTRSAQLERRIQDEKRCKCRLVKGCDIARMQRLRDVLQSAQLEDATLHNQVVEEIERFWQDFAEARVLDAIIKRRQILREFRISYALEFLLKSLLTRGRVVISN